MLLKLKGKGEFLKNVFLLIKKPLRDYYFIRLNKELQNLGVNLFFFKKFEKIFPILRNLLFTKCRILHVHWLFIVGFDSSNMLKIILKSLSLMMEIFLIKHLLKAKIIWTVHNLFNHDSFYPNFEKFFKRAFSKKVDVITCHCEEAKKKIHRIFGVSSKKIFVIPHGNYFSCYKNDITQEEARDYLKLEKDDFILLHFGRIRPYKGIDMLIKSFQKLKTNIHIKLIIAGEVLDQNYKQYLLKLSKENKDIIFKFKFISDDDIQIYMNASDVVVTPYQRVLTSGEVLLAMTFGKAIIAPKLGCIINVLDGQGSILYDANDKDTLKLALEEAIMNKEKLEQMGKHNYNLAKKLEWELICKKWLKVYSIL